MDTRQISTRRLVAGCEGTREGLRSARGSIAATGARFTPGQRAREGLGGQVARSLRRPSGNRSRDDARRGRPRMLPKYSSQWTKRSRDEVSAIQDRCALRQRIEQGKDHRVTPVKPRGGRPAAIALPCRRSAEGHRRPWWAITPHPPLFRRPRAVSVRVVEPQSKRPWRLGRPPPAGTSPAREPHRPPARSSSQACLTARIAGPRTGGRRFAAVDAARCAGGRPVGAATRGSRARGSAGSGHHGGGL
jgi:hypothetical protein